MDWDTQPDPFRRYEGATLVALPLPDGDDGPSLAWVLGGRVAPAAPVDVESVSRLFYDSLAISAWKAYRGSRWSLRVNPSSGNLHPTEGYLICGGMEGIHDAPAVHHYAPLAHALERRAVLPAEAWAELLGCLPPGSLLVGLSSIFWRESWKYGERAFRYCQHDVGHAMAAVALAAAALGWRTHVLIVPDAALAALLGIRDQRGMEAEHPDVLLAISPGSEELAPASWRLPTGVIASLEGLAWRGVPNRLSHDHHEWPIIEAVAEASLLRGAPAGTFWRGTSVETEPAASPRVEASPSARRIFRTRRSAVDMDGATGMTRETFEALLGRLMPGGSREPWRGIPWRASVHVVLFVHRVSDLEPGIYVLARDPAAVPTLKLAMRPGLAWAKPDGCPAELPLYLLQAKDVRGSAAGASCGQSIASDGAFAVAMLGMLDQALHDAGPYGYRCLHWESGAIGQVLYLEAEAAGIRGTGIGCFFDDATHAIVGLRGTAIQTIYHFAVGGPVDDPRLETLPAYAHLAAPSKGTAGPDGPGRP